MTARTRPASVIFSVKGERVAMVVKAAGDRQDASGIGDLLGKDAAASSGQRVIARALMLAPFGCERRPKRWCASCAGRIHGGAPGGSPTRWRNPGSLRWA